MIKAASLSSSAVWLSEDKWSGEILIISWRAKNQSGAAWAWKVHIIYPLKPAKTTRRIIKCWLGPLNGRFSGPAACPRIYIFRWLICSRLSQGAFQSFNCRGWRAVTQLLLSSATTKKKQRIRGSGIDILLFFSPKLPNKNVAKWRRVQCQSAPREIEHRDSLWGLGLGHLKFKTRFSTLWSPCGCDLYILYSWSNWIVKYKGCKTCVTASGFCSL